MHLIKCACIVSNLFASLQITVQLRKQINFDDEDGAVVDPIEDERKFDQLIENLLNKNEQLQ